MIIQYFAHLRDVTRRNEENFATSANTVGVLLAELCRRYGPNFRKWVLTPEGELSEMSIVLVNGSDIRHTGRLDTPISSADTICIFPPVAGG